MPRSDFEFKEVSLSLWYSFEDPRSSSNKISQLDNWVSKYVVASRFDFREGSGNEWQSEVSRWAASELGQLWSSEIGDRRPAWWHPSARLVLSGARAAGSWERTLLASSIGAGQSGNLDFRGFSLLLFKTKSSNDDKTVFNYFVSQAAMRWSYYSQKTFGIESY